MTEAERGALRDGHRLPDEDVPLEALPLEKQVDALSDAVLVLEADLAKERRRVRSQRMHLQRGAAAKQEAMAAADLAQRRASSAEAKFEALRADLGTDLNVRLREKVARLQEENRGLLQMIRSATLALAAADARATRDTLLREAAERVLATRDRQLRDAAERELEHRATNLARQRPTTASPYVEILERQVAALRTAQEEDLPAGDASKGGVCTICLSASAKLAHIPCGCLTYCGACYVSAEEHAHVSRCPRCRAEGGRVLRIFNLAEE